MGLKAFAGKEGIDHVTQSFVPDGWGSDDRGGSDLSGT